MNDPREKINLELRKFVAPEVIFGEGSIDLAAQYALKYGSTHPLIVSDPGVVRAGWADRVVQGVQAQKLSYTLFTAVSSNPRETEVMNGVDIFRNSRCDSIIAVGGGSVLDCAKGIGIVVSNNQHILTFEGVDKISVPMPPLICIPTTGGTSADVSQFAIINDTQRRTKIAIISKAIVPDVSLIDPVTLTTMDPYLTACTGLDALVHGIEAYVSNGQSMMTDIHALKSIELITKYLLRSIENPHDIEARGLIMMGSLQAGLAFSNASLGAVHATAHSLGGFKDLPHGECNAILLRSVIDFNYSRVPERFKAIGETMGLQLGGLNSMEVKKTILDFVENLKQNAGVRDTLGSRGIQYGDIHDLADRAVVDPCLLTNPRKANKRDLEVIYEEST